MKMKHWTVIAKDIAPDGRITLTLRDEHGTILTEDYAPDEVVWKVVEK